MSSMSKNEELQALIWKRNAHLPEAISECVHNLISDRARAQPNALAVCATKGRNITYYDLDTLSDKLAQRLSLIVPPGAIVPLCFEKSVWTPVAMLAVLKIQAAFVLLDVGQPEARLQSIIKQTKAEVIICSKAHIDMGSILISINETKKPCTITQPEADIDAFILISSSESKEKSNVTRSSLSETYSTMACYVVFTSGTTGTPKGAVLTHTNICSALKYQLEHLGFNQDSRVFDFASYSFDVAVHNMPATLVGGGALCIPTSTERLQDPAGAMTSMGVNLVNLTPSVARLIDPSRITTLKTIIFLGETLTQVEAERWANSGKKIRLINTYGPAECTPVSTIESIPQFSPGQINMGIGLPFGCVAWLVDPEDHHSLAPHDELGELLIEGPLVGLGYLNEPEKTQQSFVSSPRWLRNMRPFSRLYKTGDLAMYNPDGSLRFMGRKDTQIKINGQRVELGEIEHHVLNIFPNAVQVVVDEVISSGSRSLAAFIQLNATVDEPTTQNELEMNLIEPKQQLNLDLSCRLPRYMIPTSFILVTTIPKTPSGKTDRKTLRQKGSDVLSTMAATSHLSKERQPISNAERIIQSCWATVLSRPIESFGLEDVFLGAGGDSLTAIQLVMEARKNKIHIVIADVLNPETTLHDLAQSSTVVTEEELVPQFSLLKDAGSSQMEDISGNCGISPDAIEDVYPCTPMQEGLIALTMQQAGDYILRIKVPLGHLNEDLAKEAWEQMTKKTSIFRTRIVQSNLGLLQVVLKQEHSPIQWLPFENLQDYLDADKTDIMKLGKPLARFAITNDSVVYNSEKYMVITLHHALYDGWSLDLMMDQVDRLYRGGGDDERQSASPTPQFNSFVKYVEKQRTDPASNEYWQKYLQDAQPVQFPHVHRSDHHSTRKASIMEFDCQLTQGTSRRSEATLSTIIRGALALLLSERTLSHDISFGATVSGRTALTPNIERIVGPTIATVPIRVHLEEPGRTTVSEFYRQLQVQATEMIPYEQTGLQNIGKLGDSARKVCEFQTLLVIQPQDESQIHEMSWQMETEQLNTYALTLECFPQRNGDIMIQARYDSAVLESWELEKMLEQMGWIINKLMDPQSVNVTLDVLDLMPMRHQEKIWEWNGNVPPGVEKTIHDLFQEQVSYQNDSHLAVHAWDGKLTYRELDQVTDQLAAHLRLLGVNDGHLIPVCFEKTVFAIIAMLGILKSGAGFVPIEPSLPKDRRQTILKEIKPPLVLSCDTCENLFQGLIDIPTVSLDWDLLRSVSQDDQTTALDQRAKLSVSSTAYVIFTSGSTGKPKGVVVPHGAASSSCTAHGEVLGFNNTSRVYQFSSYSFDACIAEIFTTLIFGGCVCIPSSEARLSQLSETIDSMGVNWMFLTPAVARLIEPSAVPSVRFIAIGGEKFSSADAERWLTDGRRVFLVYGPTECCVYCSGHDLEDGVDSRYIGLPIGCLAWIVFPDDHNRLTPLGGVGELLIEGPIVSGGYLNSPEKSQQSFISSPRWLRGVRPSSRLYKTGDLVQYAPKSRNDTGRLKFVGRKDTQVKLRGQRLELAEVEHHIQQSIPTAKQVITEVANPGENKSSELLVAFVEMQTKSCPLSHTSDQVSTASNSASAILMQLASQEKQQIAGRLPPYMIPEFYFCITGSMPRMVSSGKTDRKQLRELGANLVTQYRMQSGISTREKRAPSNEVEKKLLDIWKRVLNVPDGEEIGVDEFWETLGGDSIASMRLVGEARKIGFSFTVADIRRTTIAAQAQIQNNLAYSSPKSNEIAPFTLLPLHVDVQLLLSDMGLSNSTEIEDIYPCTPLQEGIMALSGKHSGDYVLINVLELHEGLRLDSFKAAWEEAVRLTPALRTQIVAHSELGLLQLVLKGKPNWMIKEEYDLERYMEEAKLSPMGLGQPLSRFALLGPGDQPTYFVWTYHHSLYDGWSLPLITDLAVRIYQDDLSGQSLQPFKAFVKYAEQSKGAAMDSYWRKYLDGNESSPFPALPSQIREPVADMMQERGISHFGLTPSDISISTLLRAALGVVLGSFSGSSDATFGATLSGRNASVPGIADIIGPTIATVPVRIKIPAEHDSEAIVSWLKEVQQQATDMIPFEQAGLQHISRLSDDTQRACQFGTLLVIQADSQGLTSSPTFGTWKPSDDQSGFTTYSLTLEYIPSTKKGQLAIFRAGFDSRVINAWTVERLLGQWEYVTQQLVEVVSAQISSGASSLVDIDLLTSSDRNILEKWNISSPAPLPVERCIHAMVSEQAQARKGCAAVDGWDGQLSYGQFETVTSRLAEHLLNLGVGPEVFVPICFPKSTWTIVAMFGVLKAGAAFVLLDPLHPQSRLCMLCEKTRATIAIASAPSTASKIEAFVETVIMVDENIKSPDWAPQIVKSTSTSPSTSPPLSAAPSASSSVELVSPKNTAYIIFTSGSTGAPKGCKIPHVGYCSTAVYHGSVQNMSTETRSLQFGSYSFAGAIMEILMTLIYGGCVCVPSSNDLSLLSSEIRRLNANWAFLTSTVLSALHPDEVPSLKTICVGGEPIQASQITQWSNRVHLRQTYGSAETSAVVSSAHLTGNATTGDVGRPTTGRYWIVDPQNTNKLAPLGSAGEVIIEGPTIGREYLDEPQKSAAAFIAVPSWRTDVFGPVQQGSRFYKTGDLGSYTSDGSIVLMGRKDTQVKLRGQRIELGEVEHQTRLASDLLKEVAVEIIVPKDSVAKANAAILVAFFVLHDNSQSEGSKSEVVASIRDRLYHILPQYMVPSAFLDLTEMPKTISKKTDRRRLREIATSYPREELFKLNMAPSGEGLKRQPSTKQEQILHDIWSHVLGLDKIKFGVEDDFFSLSGDSISALKMVAEARRSGIEISMTSIFVERDIVSLARVASYTAVLESSEPIPSFSLIPSTTDIDVDELRKILAAPCGVDPNQIEDAYPCTPLQEGLLALTMQKPGNYVMQNVLQIAEDVNVEALQNAWQLVLSSTPILRTRMVDHHSFGLLQVVINKPIEWEDSSIEQGLAYLLEDDKARPLEFGSSLARFTMAGTQEYGQPRWLIWTVHHSAYDGWSMPLILEMVKDAYTSQKAPDRHDFVPFVKYLHDSDSNSSQEYWRSTMELYESGPFPSLPALKYKPMANQVIERTAEIPASNGQPGITLPIIARAGLGILIKRHTSTDDIVFGTILSGHNAPIPGIEDLVGPTIATVPIRIQFPEGQSVHDYVHALQQQSIQMIPFEQFGLQNISKSNPNACNFQTLLVVHSSDERVENADTNVLGTWLTDADQSGFTTYALTLECYLPSKNGDPIKLRATFDQKIIPEWEMGQFMDQYLFVLQQLIVVGPECTVSDIDLMTPVNRALVWQRNATVPDSIDRCVHDLIRERTEMQPHSIALTSLEGDMSYEELEILSDRLACQLIKQDGYYTGALVPLCFEKSIWTVVAMLASMKSGLTAVTFDTTQPVERVKTIVRQMGEPPFIISSVLRNSMAAELLPDRPLVEVGPKLKLFDLEKHDQLPTVSPFALLCVVFTSGSTGVPKGVAWCHKNMASGIQYQSKAFGHGPGARIFAFASYSFDISWHDTLNALSSGSTLCIPSEAQRKDNLESSIASFGATVAFLTPSVARLLRPEAIPSLRLLALGGEPQRWADFRDWPDHVAKLSVYGPAECTVVSGAEDARAVLEPRDFTLPSHGNLGLNLWLVDPLNPNLLVPPGVTGEIWLEGPLVGAGYIGDEKKTAASFTQDPSWLLRGGGVNFPGRRGRLYKTGDTARYSSDGRLWFMGRKDTQVKIRGQRVELSEVEYHVRQATGNGSEGPRQVVAEIILLTTEDGESNPMLVVFIENLVDQDSRNVSGKPEQKDLQVNLTSIKPGITEELLRHIPSYMVPRVYFSTSFIPKTVNGKTDRKLLRQIGSEFSIHQLAQLHSVSAKRQPISAAELSLQRLWAQVLKLPLERIGCDDNFFQLGGDSIAAMHLSALARTQGSTLTVAAIFNTPLLSSQAKTHFQDRRGNLMSASEQSTAPFALLPSSIDIASLCKDLTSTFEISGIVEDIYPCTPLQEGLLALTSKTAGNYVMQSVLKLPNSPSFNLSAFKSAWDAVVDRFDILRTRIVEHEEVGLVQMVLKQDSISWIHHPNETLQSYCSRDKLAPMDLGRPLVRFGLIGTHEMTDNPRWFVWTAHHALYDGWSLPIVTKQAVSNYRHILDGHLPQASQAKFKFNEFVRYSEEQKADPSVDDYWREALACKGADEAVQFPPLPGSTQQPNADHMAEKFCPVSLDNKSSVTTSTFVRAALALLLSHQTGVSEALFGATVSGRNAPIPGIEQIVGPSIATVPVKISTPKESSVGDYLMSVQRQAAEMIPYEQTGLQRISKVSEEVRHLQTLLVVQSPSESSADEGSDHDYGIWRTDDSQKGFTTYGLTIECYPIEDNTGFRFRASFDEKIIEPWRMERLLVQLSFLTQQLARVSDDTLLAEIDPLPQEDHDLIWGWNAIVPETVNRCVHDMIYETATQQPDAQAVHAWDGNFTYAQLDSMADSLAALLLAKGVTPGTIVPLCFEKSKWTVVGVLGVLKAGAAFVFLDAETQPEARLRAIHEQSKASVICSSIRHEELGRRFGADVIVVGPESLTPATATIFLPNVHPSSPLYLNFTSGSTGNPKGAIISHRSFASALTYQLRPLNISQATRLYDFASYSFDVAIHNVLSTLAAGGCLCVPSELHRKSRLAESMEEMRANYADLTASVSRLIDPLEVPTLRTLTLGGEPVTQDDAERWWGKVKLINSCGPSECTPMSVINSTPGNPTELRRIGLGTGMLTWVVDPKDHNRLLPVGQVGELILEGPLLGSGYLEDPSRTEAVFIEAPRWLSGHRSQPTHVYKTGDLVQYHIDGSIHIVSRKDNQVKVRGQRVELEEVEHHLRRHVPQELSVVAEAVAMNPSATLVAFVSQSSQTTTATPQLDAEQMTTIATLARTVAKNMSTSLPPYMVPSIYIPVMAMPMTTTGKTNRKELRNLASSLPREKLDLMRGLSANDAPRKAPTTAMEITFRDMWARILNLPIDSIGIDDEFQTLGGDSILAMRIVAEARRKQGLHLSVAEIFGERTISNILKNKSFVKDFSTQISTSIQPYTLVGETIKQGVLSTVPFQQIEDILPVTDFQTQNIPHPCNYFYLDLDTLTINEERLRRSCQSVVDHYPLLRSTFVPFDNGYWQVVMHQSAISYNVITSERPLDEVSDEFCESDIDQKLHSKNPLTKFVLVRGRDSNSKATISRLIIRLSHAQYDGFSLPVILQNLADLYDSRIDAASLGSPDTSFASYLAQSTGNRQQCLSYWQEYLAGSQNTHVASALSLLPELAPSSDAEPFHKVQAEGLVPIPTREKRNPSSAPQSTVLASAWAILLSILTGREDVIFGHLIANREGSRADVIGLVVTIAPVRVRVQAPSKENPSAFEIHRMSHTIQDHLLSIQAIGIGNGWEDVLRSCTDWCVDKAATPGDKFSMSLQSLVQHQNIDENPGIEIAGVRSKLHWYEDLHSVPPVPLGIVSYPVSDGSGLRIRVMGSSQFMTNEAARHLVECLAEIVTLLFVENMDEKAELAAWESLYTSIVGKS